MIDRLFFQSICRLIGCVSPLLALKIHVSCECKDLLEHEGGYVFEERGVVKMKGKGEVLTYWLLRHEEGPKHRRTGSTGPIGGQYSGSVYEHGSYQEQPQLFSLTQMDKRRKKTESAGGGGSMSRRGSNATFRAEDSLINLALGTSKNQSSKLESTGSILHQSPSILKRRLRNIWAGSRDAMVEELPKKSHIGNSSLVPNMAEANSTTVVAMSNGTNAVVATNGSHSNNSFAVPGMLRNNNSWSNFRFAPKSSASLSSSFAEVLENESIDEKGNTHLSTIRGQDRHQTNPSPDMPLLEDNRPVYGAGHARSIETLVAGVSNEADTPTLTSNSHKMTTIDFRCTHSRPCESESAHGFRRRLSELEDQRIPLLDDFSCNGCLTNETTDETNNTRLVDQCNNHLAAGQTESGRKQQLVAHSFSSNVGNRKPGLDKRWRSHADVFGHSTSQFVCGGDGRRPAYSGDSGSGRSDSHSVRASVSNLNRYLQNGRQLGLSFLQSFNWSGRTAAAVAAAAADNRFPPHPMDDGSSSLNESKLVPNETTTAVAGCWEKSKNGPLSDCEVEGAV